MKCPALWFLALTPLLFPRGTIAQEPEVYEDVEVVLRQIQVNVRDRDGRHVPGLVADDFQIKLNGRKQDIELVEEISIDAALSGERESENASRVFVFFFDLRYTNKAGVLKSRAAVQRFVENQMTDLDQAGVFTFEPINGVNMVLAPTANRARLGEAIEWLGLASGEFLGAQSDRVREMGDTFQAAQSELQALVDSRPDDAADDGQRPVGGPESDESLLEMQLEHFMDVARQADRANKDIYQRDVLNFLNSFKVFADSLRAVDGRKNLVWFSAGFDSSALSGGSVQEMVENSQNIEFGEYYKVDSDQYGAANLQQEANAVVDMFRGSDTMIFAVDLGHFSDGSGSRQGVQSLNLFASDTGGDVFERHADLTEPLKHIDELTKDYYLISFKPSKLRENQVGKLRVKVDRPRVEVFAVRGMSLNNKPQLVSPLAAQIQLQEFIDEDRRLNGVPIEVQARTLPFDQGLVQVNVEVAAPGDYFLGGANDARRLEIFAFALDLDKDLLADQSAFQFQIEPAKVRDILGETGVKYFGNLFLAPGRYKIKVVARDRTAGKVGATWIETKVEPPTGGLTGPVMLSEERWVLMRNPAPPAKIKALAGDFTLGFPYDVSGGGLIPAAENVFPANGQGNFFFLLEGDYADQPPGVAALIMNPQGQTTVIPPDAMKGRFQAHRGGGPCLAFMLTVDFAKLGLEAGAPYKLMTQFRAGDGPPLRAVLEAAVR